MSIRKGSRHNRLPFLCIIFPQVMGANQAPIDLSGQINEVLRLPRLGLPRRRVQSGHPIGLDPHGHFPF